MTTMNDWLERSRLVYGDAGIDRLAAATVVICGVGGVGSFAVEALARSGIGRLILIDHDKVVESNINRQLVATTKTLGQAKVEVAAARIAEINPSAKVWAIADFYSGDLISFWQKQQETLPDLPPLAEIDYIVDAIDSLRAKQELIISSHRQEIPCITALGAGNKLDPSQFQVTDLAKTYNDRLARVLRRELRKHRIYHHPVVFSPEIPHKNGSTTIGSTAFVPPVCGMILAGTVVKNLLADIIKS